MPLAVPAGILRQGLRQGQAGFAGRARQVIFGSVGVLLKGTFPCSKWKVLNKSPELSEG